MICERLDAICVRSTCERQRQLATTSENPEAGSDNYRRPYGAIRASERGPALPKLSILRIFLSSYCQFTSLFSFSYCFTLSPFAFLSFCTSGYLYSCTLHHFRETEYIPTLFSTRTPEACFFVPPQASAGAAIVLFCFGHGQRRMSASACISVTF